MDIESNGRRAEAETSAGKDSESQARQKKLGALIRRLIWWVACAALGYLAGSASLPFGAQPFGAALLSAAGFETFPIFAGLCLSAASGDHPWLFVGIWSAVLCARILARTLIDTPAEKPRGIRELLPYLFTERIALRMATAALCSFATSLPSVLRGGFLYYDVIGTAISVISAPIAAFLFSWAFSSQGKLMSRRAADTGIWRLTDRNCSTADIKKSVGAAAIFLFLVFTLRGNLYYSLSLSAFFAMTGTLFFCRTRGMLFGGVVGLALGLAYSPLLAPIFVFAAFISGIAFRFSVPLAAWTSFAAGIFWGFYVKGISALSGLFPALLAASLLFTVIDKLFIAERIAADENPHAREQKTPNKLPRVVPLPDSALDIARLDRTKQKIKSLCETLTELSETFGEMSKRRYRSPAESYMNICEAAFDSSCTGCRNRESCHGQVSVREEAERLARVILKNRAVCMSDAGQALSANCERLPDIIDEINHNTSVSARSALECDRSEIFALDYAAVADLLAEAQVEEAEEMVIDAKLTSVLCDAISALGLEPAPVGAMVYGKNRRRITVQGKYEMLVSNIERILSAADRALPFKTDRSSAYVYEGGVCELRANEAQRLSVTSSLRCAMAAGENEVCGDSMSVFSDGDGHFFSCISDGMGSGRRAANASRICVEFIEKMLSSGAASYGRSAKSVIEMLNGFLRTKNFGSINECSSTVDLLELDLVNKSAFFCKCGAAPTYVFRSGSLFKLRSETLPIGIMDKVDCRAIKFDVDAGDLLVMVSDGVVQGKEECPWLFDLLRANAESASPDSIADKIVKYAKNLGSADDISVAVIKIKG